MAGSCGEAREAGGVGYPERKQYRWKEPRVPDVPLRESDVR
jgi:hypothetical protein